MQQQVRTNEAIWHDATPFFVGRAPKRLQAWLVDSDSLTKGLISHCSDQFKVHVYRQYWQPALFSEAQQLGIPVKTTAFVREVHLYCGKNDWVFARTVIPMQTLRGELQKLTALGAQPLGAVLFANHSIKRGPIQVAHIKPTNNMYNDATVKSTQSEPLWGRRSLFYLGKNPLLVNELFLEKLPIKAK